MYTKLNIPGLIDSVNEQFDSAVEYMRPGTFIFGDVLRNLIAGIVPARPCNTLYMLMGLSEFKYVVTDFSKSTKWLMVTTGIIRKEAEFVNMYGAKVRLIGSDSATVTPHRVMDYVNKLRCNCLVMDHNGVVLEVVPGAYNDCQNKELHLADDFTSDLAAQITNPYVKEGWVNKISRKQVRKTSKAKSVKPKPLRSRSPIQKQDMGLSWDLDKVATIMQGYNTTKR